jgi:hypothetical protein
MPAPGTVPLDIPAVMAEQTRLGTHVVGLSIAATDEQAGENRAPAPGAQLRRLPPERLQVEPGPAGPLRAVRPDRTWPRPWRS